MTVRVDDINSISGFLQPEDQIDLLLSYGSAEAQHIFPLIQSLNVIATGIQTLVDKNGQVSQRNFSTITVQVSPEQAKKITLAQQVGKLTALLRNPDDDAPLSNQPLSVAHLLNGSQTPSINATKVARPRSIKKQSIEYIIGGS